MNAFCLIANFLLRYCKVTFVRTCSKSTYVRDGQKVRSEMITSTEK